MLEVFKVKNAIFSYFKRQSWLPFELSFARASWLILVVIILVSVVPYRHLIGRGYSDADDFLEIHRAVTTDIPAPDRIFLSSHYGDRYRPINRFLTAATVYVAKGSSDGFLVRNLILHITSIALVFHIALILTRSQLAAALAACLFAFHPANTNVVSVAVFTHFFGACLTLWAVYILANQHQSRHLARNWRLAFVFVLLTVVTFSNEMFLWVLPTYALVLLWIYFRRERSKSYLTVALLALIGLVAYLVIRQAIIEDVAIMARSVSDRTGLQDTAQVLHNFGMFLVGSGISLDPLHFINPVDDALPTSLIAISSPGLLASMAMGLLCTTTTIIGSMILTLKRNTMLSVAFTILFLLSISIVTLVASASETYLYLPNAFLAMAQSFILVELGALCSSSAQPYRRLGMWVLVAVLVLVFTTRIAGVENRNRILNDKASRIAHLQSELRRATAGFKGDQIVFVPACETHKGYSVYGGRGTVLIRGSETPFVQLTLGRDITAELSDMGSLRSGKLSLGTPTRVLIVDSVGNLYPTIQSSFKCEP